MAAEIDEQTGEVTQAFDPGKHTRSLSGNEYLDVKWRVVWFRRDHPGGIIETDLVAHERTPDMKDAFALFKCKVIIPGKAPGQVGVHVTGWGSETKQDFRDYIEKAETKSIGRALALMGYGTASLPDDGDRIADTPVEPGHRRRDADPPIERPKQDGPRNPPANFTMRDPGGKATEKQVDAIIRIAARKKVSEDDLAAHLQAQYGTEVLDDLTKGQASDVIKLIGDEHFTAFLAPIDNAPVRSDAAAGTDDGDDLTDARF